MVLLKNIEDLYTWPAVERAKPYIPLYFTQLHVGASEGGSKNGNQYIRYGTSALTWVTGAVPVHVEDHELDR